MLKRSPANSHRNTWDNSPMMERINTEEQSRRWEVLHSRHELEWRDPWRSLGKVPRSIPGYNAHERRCYYAAF